MADLDREQCTDGPIDYFTVDIGMFQDSRYLERNDEIQDLTVAGSGTAARLLDRSTSSAFKALAQLLLSRQDRSARGSISFARGASLDVRRGSSVEIGCSGDEDVVRCPSPKRTALCDCREGACGACRAFLKEGHYTGLSA